MSPARALAPFATTLLVMACGSAEGGASPEAVEAIDSAGIRITLHPRPAAVDTVDPKPVLVIGEEGDPRYEFFRIASVVPLGSGGVVVGNGGSMEIRWYAEDGTYRGAAGGPGDGPEELGFLTSVWPWAGDTVAVMDPRRRRLLFFDSVGSFGRARSFAEDIGFEQPEGARMCTFPGAAGLLADGTLLARGWGCLGLQGSDGVRAWGNPMFLVGPGGVDTVGLFEIDGVWERGGATDPRDMYDFLPFAPPFRQAVAGDRVLVSRGSAYELTVYDRRGRVVEKVRETGAPPPITDEDRAAYIAEQEAADRPHPDDVPFPERFGSYARLVVAHEGDVWAQHQPGPGAVDRLWSVFPADGRAVRHVVLPPLQVEAVRDGRIYGYRSDDLGIQRVEVYRVPWPGEDGGMR